MADKSTTLSNAMLNLVLRNVAYSPSTTNVFVALYVGDPKTTGVEISTVGTNYSRKQVTFSAASNGQTSNNAEVDFGVASADYSASNVDYFALLDNSTGGNILYSDLLTVAQKISQGNQPKFAVNVITVQES
jgi:hypothetical protein